MFVIGIDTSGLCGSVALVRDGECLEQRSLQQTGRRHAQALVLELRELMTVQKLTSRQVEAVAVSRGPGSFTGLRVGLVCAKTFAYATRCQFVAVDTFLAVATKCPTEVHSIWIVEDAQRGELFAGRYQRCGEGGWQQTNPIAIVEGETWLAARSADEVITGRGLARHDLTSVQARCLTSEEIITPSAAAIAQLGVRRLESRIPSEAADPDFDFWRAVPFYLRSSAAEEQRDKRSATS